MNFKNFGKKGASKWRGGYIVVTATIFFVVITLTVIFGIVTPTIAQVKNASLSFTSRESYFLAEAGIEDAIYKAKSGHTVAPTTIQINGDTTTISVVENAGEKIITSSANKNGTLRKVEARLVGDSGATFTNAVFSGNGGFNITGGSQVYGSVYSNGDIIGSGGAQILSNGSVIGSATSATLISPSTNQTNGTAFPPTNEIIFGGRDSVTTYSDDFAQSFQVSTTTQVTSVRLYMKRTPASWMNGITLRIMSNNGSNPGNSTLATASIPYTQVPTSYGYVAAFLSSAPVLTAGTTYWIILDTGSTYGAWYYVAASQNTYANGVAKVGRYNNSWLNTSPADLDAYFDIIVGGDTGLISGISNISQNAWAYNVSNSTVNGSLYCQTGSGNNVACNTSRADPSPISFPITDQNISTWKSGVTGAISPVISGGSVYTGNLTIGNLGTTTTTLRKVVGNLILSCSTNPANFGDIWVTGNLTITGGCVFNANQVKVDGNVSVGSNSGNVDALEIGGDLTVSSGGTLKAGPVKVNGTATIGTTGLTLKGTLWVVGMLTMSSGGTISFDSSFGSQTGVVLVDSRIDLGGGGNFSGSGWAGSYPLIITTSTCPAGTGCSNKNAVEMNGGAGAVIIVAQNGTINMTGGTAVKALVGNQVKLSGGATVTYDNDLALLDFASGLDGDYSIQLWKEVE